MAKVLKKGAKGLSCPECKGHDVAVYDDNVVMKTSVNLNPLHPFTLTKTKKVQKKKLSAAKIGLGVATCGTSLLVTGARSKVKRQWYCKDCGCIFEE